MANPSGTSPAPFSLFLLFLASISALIAPSTSCNHSLAATCSLTRHRSLCITTLSSSSARHPSCRPMQWWARAAVAAALSETENSYRSITRSKEIVTKRSEKHAKAALSDCVECFGDAVSQLRESLAELRRPTERKGFGLRMNDVETWVSAVLTNQDTCREGLAGWRGPTAERVRSRVLNATYLTSNALALINKLAADGGSA